MKRCMSVKRADSFNVNTLRWKCTTKEQIRPEYAATKAKLKTKG